MRPLLMLLLITLTACAGAPSLPENTVLIVATPTYGLAGQSISVDATLESANQTRIALDAQLADAATQAARATADHVATLTALDMRASAEALDRQNSDATATAAAQATATQMAAALMTEQAVVSATERAKTESIALTDEARAASVADAEAEASKQKAASDIARAIEFDRFWHDLLTYGVIVFVLVWGGFWVAVAVVVVVWLDNRRQLAYVAAYQTGLIAIEERRLELERARAEVLLSLIKTINGQQMIFTPRDGGSWRPMVIEAPKAVDDLARAQDWRQVGKMLLAHGVQLERAGVKHPFSETNLSPLCFKPGTHDVWLAGYRVSMDMLIKAGVLVPTGRRSAPTWAADWTPERVEHEFDRIPLPYLPEGAPPDVTPPIWSFGEALVSA